MHLGAPQRRGAVLGTPAELSDVAPAVPEDARVSDDVPTDDEGPDDEGPDDEEDDGEEDDGEEDDEEQEV